MSKAEKPNKKPIENKYKKQLILNSKYFSSVEKDLLTTMLDDKKEYSINECLNILEKEKKRTVK